MKFYLLLVVFILILSTLALASPVEITIDYGNCTENWSCNDWSSCSGGIQTRTCTDANSCGTTVNKSTTSQSCTSGTSSGPGASSGPINTENVKVGNKTITQPTPNVPSTPQTKESPDIKLKLSTIDEVEAGEPFGVNVTISSTTVLDTTVELLGIQQHVSLNAGEAKTLYFDVYAPESEGNYNLVAVTPYATGNKNILLDYKPLFLYVNPIGNQTYEIHIKNFDNTSTTELEIVKDNYETVYLDTLNGKMDYKVNLTFPSAGEYVVKAKAISGMSILDEDSRAFSIEAGSVINYGLLILIVVLIIILIGSILIFKELRR